MKKTFVKLFLTLCAVLASVPVDAEVKYWDGNGDTTGAGTAPAGNWASSAFWSSASDGTATPAVWVAGDEAVFSAGTDATGAYTVTLGSATAAAITIEEGTVTLGGSGAVTLGAGPITINSGATLETSSSVRISATAGSVMTINGGTARSTNPGANGSFVDVDQAIVLNGGGTLSYTVAGLLNIISGSTVISGTGPMIKDGAGILAIATACTYSGSTIISNGTLRVRTSSNRLPTGTDLFVYAPGVFDPGSTSGNVQQVNSINGDGNITYSASSTLIVAGSGSSTIAGVISDGASFGRISKQGSGTLTLSGINTYDGSFTNVAGTTIVTSGATLFDAGGDLVINGGTVNLENAAQTVLSLSGTGGTLSLSSGHAFTINPAGTRSFLGAVTGAASVTKTGAGTTGLLGPNSYTGATAVNAGKLITSTASTGAGSFSVADTATLGAKVAAVGTSLAMSDLTLGNSSMEFDFADLGYPTTKIVNDTGPITVNGAVAVNAKGFTTTGTATLLEYAGARGGAGSFATGLFPPHTGGEITDDTGNSKVLITVTNADTLVWVSDANGVWDINNAGNQIWNLVPANTAGEYQENAMQGDTVRFDDTATGITTVNIPATISPYKVTVDNTTKTYAFNGLGRISGIASLTKSGTGELIVTTTNNYSGGTTINDGTVSLGTDSVFGSGKVTLNGGTLRSDSATAHSSSTPVDLNANVTLGSAANFGDLTFSTGAWTITGGSRQITVDTINATISSSIGEDAAGRALTKAGGGTLSLTAANTFTGGFNHNAGTVRVNTTTALGAANSPVTYADGVTLSTTAGTGRTLTYAHNLNGNLTLGQASGGTAAVTLAGTIDLGGSTRTVTVVNATDNFGGVVSNGGLVKEGTGRLLLQNVANTFSGNSTINAGYLGIDGDASIGDGTGRLIFNGGGLEVSADRGTLVTPNPITISQDAVIRTTSAATAPNVRFGTSDIVVSAGRTLTLRNDGADGAADTFEVNFTGGGISYAEPIIIDNGAVGKTRLNLYNVNTDPSQTFSGVISGNGAVNRSASVSGTGGTTIFSGDNLYSGGTTVNRGTLLVNNTTGSGTGSGTVTVGNTGTLGGTGTVAGAVVVNAGGSIEGGASAGTLTLQNGLDLSLGGTNVWELAANSTNNPGANFDQIALTGGDLVLGGLSRLRVKFSGTATFPDSGNAFWQQTNVWKVITLTAPASNSGATIFSGVDGAEGNNAGSFSTSTDINGEVYLTFTPGVIPPPPLIDGNIVGAGTGNAQVSWSSLAGASYTVQYKTNLNQVGWLDLTNLTAEGPITSILDDTSPVPFERYYRVISP